MDATLEKNKEFVASLQISWVQQICSDYLLRVWVWISSVQHGHNLPFVWVWVSMQRASNIQ